MWLARPWYGVHIAEFAPVAVPRYSPEMGRQIDDDSSRAGRMLLSGRIRVLIKLACWVALI